MFKGSISRINLFEIEEGWLSCEIEE